MKLQAVVNNFLTSVRTSLQQNTSNGNDINADNNGNLIVTEGHGRYYAPTYYGIGFSASTAPGTPVTLSAGLMANSTAYTGLVITNPIGNTLNFVLNKVGISFVVAPANAAALGIQVGYNNTATISQTTALTTAGSNLVGSGFTSTALIASSVTPAGSGNTFRVPIIFGDTGTAATTATGIGTFLYDLEGAIILKPGSWAAIYSSALGGTSGTVAAFSWEEVPV